MSSVVNIPTLPTDRYLHESLDSAFDLRKKYSSLAPSAESMNSIEINIESWGIDFDRLAAEIDEIYEDVGFQGWAKPGESELDKAYGGLTLTTSRSPDFRGWERQSLGPVHLQSHLKMDQSEWASLVEKNKHGGLYTMGLEKKDIRGSYSDSYSFRFRTNFCERGREFPKLLNHFSRPFFRSRVATLKGSLGATVEEGWHRDEELCFLIRCLIPVRTSDNYRIKLKNGNEIVPRVGHAYSFDARQPHSVFSLEKEEFFRHYLIFCFAPWIDFKEDFSEAWENEHSGLIHPLELFKSGYFFKSPEAL